MVRIKVPHGQTALNDDLGHRYLDVIDEGMAARDSGVGSPYGRHSLEHCLHATGWVQRDLRLALDAARTDPAQDAGSDYVRVKRIPRGNIERLLINNDYDIEVILSSLGLIRE